MINIMEFELFVYKMYFYGFYNIPIFVSLSLLKII